MRRIVLAALALGALAPSAVFPQQGYPSRPVRLIVPYPPGGAVDAVARISALKLSEQLNQNFIIDNRAGANGVIGGEIVARAQADGYTLLSTASIHVINALVVARVPYDPVKDFTPVSQVAAGPLLVVAHPALPANGIRELIAYAKANPGKLTCAISSRGAAGHLATELLKFGASLDFLIVPYKGSGPAYIDLIGGRVQFMMDPILAALPHVKSGRLKALAVTSLKRMSMVPEVPTVVESGVVGFDFYSWYGLWGPRGMPRDVVERLAREVSRMVKQPIVAARLTEQGFEPVGSSPAAFASYIADEMAKYSKIVRQAGITAE
jgi:tripartite-type tricarboxylate transporter receptor subunit TctC